MKTCFSTLLAGAVLTCMCYRAQAQVLENNLIGLDAVLVTPSINLDPADTGTNLTTDDLKSLIEKRLRTSGISAVPSQDKYNYKSDGILDISLTTQKIGTLPTFMYTVNVSLQENATSKRIGSPNSLMVVTWSDQGSGYASSQRLGATIKSEIDTEMLLFCNDYTKDNPKN